MLDASTRMDVLNLLADLKSRGLSILFITHDLSLGYYISEKSVILYRGCVVEMGPTEQVYHGPLHPYTKMLMACVPRLGTKWECRDIDGDGPESRAFRAPQWLCVLRQVSLGRQREGLQQITIVGEVEPGHFVACWH